jgi:hypothetical protein
MDIEAKAKEVLPLIDWPGTMDPVANDIAKQRNIAVLVAAMRWAVDQAITTKHEPAPFTK